jgi:hypothetical protein
MKTGCGIDALMVVCTYAPPDGECFYPSGPCRVGREQRNAGNQCASRSQYGAHLEEVMK